MGLSRSPPQDGAPTGRSPSARAGEAARVWGCRRPSAATAQPGGRSAGWSLGALGPPAGGRGGECGLRGESSAGGELRGTRLGLPPGMHPLAAVQDVPERLRAVSKAPRGAAGEVLSLAHPAGVPGRMRCPAAPAPRRDRAASSGGTGLPAPRRNSGSRGKPSPVLRRFPPSPCRERSNFFTPLLVGRQKGLPHPRLRNRFTFQWQL